MRTPDVIIYHNPDCATSRNALGPIRNAGIEPHVIEYLKTPPSRVMLRNLIARMGISVRSLFREKGTPYHELGLDDPSLSDEQLLDAMEEHPILINRPIVVSRRGVALCRPSEKVLDILPWAQRGEFRKEDGQLVVDVRGPAGGLDARLRLGHGALPRKRSEPLLLATVVGSGIMAAKLAGGNDAIALSATRCRPAPSWSS